MPNYDVLHLLTFVDPKTGELVLNEVDDVTNDLGERDSISAEGFSKLIEFCKARLVILASCNSLLLAAYLAPYVNMVASTNWVHTKDFLKWKNPSISAFQGGVLFPRQQR